MRWLWTWRIIQCIKYWLQFVNTFLFVSHFFSFLFLLSVSTVETFSLLFHSIFFVFHWIWQSRPATQSNTPCNSVAVSAQLLIEKFRFSVLRRKIAGVSTSPSVLKCFSNISSDWNLPNFNCKENEFNFNLNWNGIVLRLANCDFIDFSCWYLSRE